MHRIITDDGTERDFLGPIVMRINAGNIFPGRYRIIDETGRTEKAFNAPHGGKLLPGVLQDLGYRIVGRVKQDSWLDDEWGYAFAVEHIERQFGFQAQILTGPYHSPNGGISARARFVTIVGDHVPEELRTHAATSSAPAVRVADFPQRCLIPAEIPEGAVGPMASGAYVIDDDSRWVALTGGQGPIPLHDRFETPAQYTALSD